MAKSEESLREKIVQWKSGLEAKGLKMNAAKMKVVFGCDCNALVYDYDICSIIMIVIRITTENEWFLAWPKCQLSTELWENRPSRFCVILQTNKQTNTSENITSLISRGSKPESDVLCNWQTVHRDWAWKSSRLPGNSR